MSTIELVALVLLLVCGIAGVVMKDWRLHFITMAITLVLILLFLFGVRH